MPIYTVNDHPLDVERELDIAYLNGENDEIFIKEVSLEEQEKAFEIFKKEYCANTMSDLGDTLSS